MTTLPHNPAPLMTENEAATILRIKPATLRRWRFEGKGPGFRKIGASVRYTPADLENFIEAAARRNTSQIGGAEK